jgi:hypothetical protein
MLVRKYLGFKKKFSSKAYEPNIDKSDLNMQKHNFQSHASHCESAILELSFRKFTWFNLN